MKPLLTLFAALFTLAAQAQTGGRVTGSIQDGNQKASESATVLLHRAKDSSVTKVGMASKTGTFSFDQLVDGRYFVSVTAVGYAKAYSLPFEIGPLQQAVSLSTIQLVPVAKTAAGVTVTAKRPLIEQKVDRTVVNVEASVTNVGASALEVLEKSPGVTVDKDGNISLKGKEGVLVLVDGRPTQLSGTDLANMLRSMNSSQLDQIEIMTNPPARFDAAGNAGVINFKTKKNKQYGYNGSLTLGYSQGRYPKTNEGLNMNYRAGKVNIFGNIGHNYRMNFNKLTIQRVIRAEDTKEIQNYFNQESRMIMQNHSYNAKVGVDYSVSKNTTVGVVLNGNSSPSTFNNRNLTLIADAANHPETQTVATADYDQSWKNFSTNFNFRTTLDTTGRELTADLDYILYDSRNEQLMFNSYFDAHGVPMSIADTLLGSLPQNIKIHSGRVDYFHPLKKSARFEAGIKSSIVKTDNNAIYDSLQNGRTVRDIGRSNYFIYEENINAAYLNLSTPLTKKISAQLGLRMENTNAKGKQMTTGENFDRTYTQLFPTAFFQYKASEKHNFGLNYGRRIRRPNYESLNPFIRFLDRYTYQQGNPNLRPQFSHNIEMSHTYRNFLTTTFNYSQTNDIIQGIIEQRGKEAFARQGNIAHLRQYGIAISANNPITKWWTNSIYVNVFNNLYSGMVNNTPIVVEATTLSLNGSQQFKFSKTWNAEISGFYRSPGVEGVVATRSMGMLSMGIGKQVMKNQGTIRLNVRDVLFTQRTRAEAKYGNVDARFQETRDSRVLNVAFTYRFTKGKMNGGNKKRTNGSASDEQSRVGGGN
jgi:outer membrane receptor protein involved in Fe transport